MARFAYQGTSKDGNGRVIPSMTVSVFEAGLTTAADVYVASSGGTSVNSVTSDSTDGSFKFWVDTADYSSSQQFKITLSKTDFTPKTYDDIRIYPFFDLNDLDDVEAGSPTNNQSLTWDSVTSKWIPETVSAGGGGSQNLFETIACPAGSNPVADEITDTLTLAVGSNKISITGDATTDKVTFDVAQGNIDHDQLSNFASNEHFTEASIDHGSIGGLGDDDHTQYVQTTGNETIAGIKTFSSFSITPSSAPSTDYQVANKKYVDDNAGSLWTDQGTYTECDTLTRFQIYDDRNEADLLIDKTKAGSGSTIYKDAQFNLTNSSTGGVMWTTFHFLDNASTNSDGGVAVFAKVIQRSGAAWDAALHAEMHSLSSGVRIAGNFEMNNGHSDVNSCYGVVINYAVVNEYFSTYYRGNAALYITGDGASDAKKWTYGIRFNASGLYGAPILMPDKVPSTSDDGQLWFDGSDLKMTIGGTNYKFDKTAA